MDVKRVTLRPATYTPERIIILDTRYRPTANEVVNENTRADRRSRATLFPVIIVDYTLAMVRRVRIRRRRPYRAVRVERMRTKTITAINNNEISRRKR